MKEKKIREEERRKIMKEMKREKHERKEKGKKRVEEISQDERKKIREKRKRKKRSSTNKEIKMERNHIFLKRGYGSIKKFGKQRWFGEQINWNEKESCFQDKGCRSIKENNNIYKRTKRVQRKEDHLIKKKNKNKR